MKAKLVKRSNGRFDLYKIEDVDQLNTIASSFDNPIGKLSLKNCEAIKNGYDLDELYLLMVSSIGYEELDYNSFEIGFLNAINFFSDKKFSEEDIKETIRIAQNIQIDEITHILTEYKEPQILQMLNRQFSEWDVEIEMDCPKYCDIECDSDCYLPNKVPKLDADGCLILRKL